MLSFLQIIIIIIITFIIIINHLKPNYDGQKTTDFDIK